MTPGQLIKKHRLKLGMTQMELATKLGYEIPQFISILEHDRSKVPKDKCADFISALGIPPKAFYIAMLNEEKESLAEACGL